MNHLKVEHFEESSASELTLKMMEFYRKNPGIGVVNIVINSVQETFGDPGTSESLTVHYGFVHYIEQSHLQVVKPGA